MFYDIIRDLRGKSIVLGGSACLLALLFGCITTPHPDPIPLIRAHAHNDYLHARPLLDALDRGFCSVEADIHLVRGQLLVAHDLEDVSPEKTLTSLYLAPLRERVRQNGGRVFRAGPVFTLLIDIKSEAEATYQALHLVLGEFQEMLTSYENGNIETRAVSVIISGNRPRETMEKQTQRWAAVDGRLPDLNTHAPLHLIPLISDNWRNHFAWDGQGHIPEPERAKLRDWISQTHEQGRRLRFWAVPDRPAMWEVLEDEGVDLINTDDLDGLQNFLFNAHH